MAEWNLYMGYWVRALASTSLGAMILHDMLTDEDGYLTVEHLEVGCAEAQKA